MLEKAMWDAHAVSGTGSTGNTASYSRQTVSTSKHSSEHNDQEYGIYTTCKVEICDI
ncbi:MAG: hypothetical protein WAT37_05520 [Saprospiraceae bacterium]